MTPRLSTRVVRWLGGFAAVSLALTAGIGSAWAQTNPTVQSLPYSQSFGTATFSTMPAGTAAWNGLNGGTLTTQALAEASSPSGLSSNASPSVCGRFACTCP